MRQISEITHDALPLADILKNHKAWLDNGRREGELINHADLRGADLRGADLRDADLRDADLWDANLWGANLRDANLRDADLRGADLRDADLRDANLRDANLRDANLRDANLRGANLRGANLRDANLRGADLRCANLWGANLRDADLWGANLWGANSILVVGPGGSRRDMLYAVIHDDAVMVKTGCFWGTISKFYDAVQEKHGEKTANGRYYQAIITLIETWAETQIDLLAETFKE